VCDKHVKFSECSLVKQDNPNRAYDIKDVIVSIVDDGEYFEPHQYYAKNIVICFARLNGRSIGIIANQPF